MEDIIKAIVLGFVEGLTLIGAYIVVLSLLLLTTLVGLPQRAGD